MAFKKFVTVISLFLLVDLTPSAPINDDLIVSLPDGKVQGARYVTSAGKKYYGFRGIPFAVPPVGELRFEPPQPIQSWQGVLHASTDGKRCMSTDHFNNPSLESENCLFINVYIPETQSQEKLPVLFWIYGGAFTGGYADKAVYGPDFIVQEDVILVSFNYRIGPFGFISTGDKALPGNIGLKDQNLALKWTRKNIKYFGGDPEKITIFGQSAGGASTGLHLVSKLSAGLFRAAIVESGSAANHWAVDQNPRPKAFSIGYKFPGANFGNDSQALKNFLKSKTAEEIQRASIQLWPTLEEPSEDAFMTQGTYGLLQNGDFNKVPIIIGICAEESLLFLGNLQNTINVAENADKNPAELIPEDLFPNTTDNYAVVEKIKRIYLKENETFKSNLVAFADYYTDYLIAKGVIKHAELSSSYVPVYFYQFAYYGRTWGKPFLDGAEKAGHSAELPFIFHIDGLSDNSVESDLLTQNRMAKLWTNFAKYLNPTPEKSKWFSNLIWPRFNNQTYSYLNINNTLEVRDNIKSHAYKQWNEVFDIYGRKPFITF